MEILFGRRLRFLPGFRRRRRRLTRGFERIEAARRVLVVDEGEIELLRWRSARATCTLTASPRR